MVVKRIQLQMASTKCASPNFKLLEHDNAAIAARFDPRHCEQCQISSFEQSAFTLLELILVMVILSTVLALAGPSLRGFFASRKTQDAAAQILALTQLAQTWAIHDGTAVRLNFDDKEQSYWLTQQKGGDFERLQTEVGQMFFLPPGTEFDLEDLEEDDGDHFVKFTPQATVTTATIRLVDRRGYVVKIVSYSATEAFVIEVLSKDESARDI